MNNQRNKATPNSKRRMSKSKRPSDFSQKDCSKSFGPDFGVATKCLTVYIKTFGCQMNSRDSEALAGLLQDRGFALTDDIRKADIVLFNTCSVRQHAEDRVWSEVGRIKKSTVYGPSTMNHRPIIGIIGCMAQNYKEEIFKRCPQVDLVVGPNDLTSIPALLQALFKERSKALAVGAMERERNLYVSQFRQDKNHAYVVISEGCSNFCSYCVVPFVRGRLRSRGTDEILEEIKNTVALGIKHITLLGQNVNSYCDSENKIDFVKLIQSVAQIPGLESFDFVTSHPKDTGVKLFKAMAQLENIKKSLHLPVQSGSNRILQLMNRGYTREHHLKLAGDYKKIVGGRLTTDIIVGFPTETERDFQDTLDLMKRVRFDAAYIFKYSPRPQTQASNLADDVPLEEKKRRHQICLDLQKKISGEKKCTKKS